MVYFLLIATLLMSGIATASQSDDIEPKEDSLVLSKTINKIHYGLVHAHKNLMNDDEKCGTLKCYKAQQAYLNKISDGKYFSRGSILSKRADTQKNQNEEEYWHAMDKVAINAILLNKYPDLFLTMIDEYGQTYRQAYQNAWLNSDNPTKCAKGIETLKHQGTKEILKKYLLENNKLEYLFESETIKKAHPWQQEDFDRNTFAVAGQWVIQTEGTNVNFCKLTSDTTAPLVITSKNFAGHYCDGIGRVVLASNGLMILRTWYDNDKFAIYLYHLGSDKEPKLLTLTNTHRSSLGITNDGTRFFITKQNNECVIYDYDAATEEKKVRSWIIQEAENHSIDNLRLTKDGKKLIGILINEENNIYKTLYIQVDSGISAMVPLELEPFNFLDNTKQGSISKNGNSIAIITCSSGKLPKLKLYTYDESTKGYKLTKTQEVQLPNSFLSSNRHDTINQLLLDDAGTYLVVTGHYRDFDFGQKWFYGAINLTTDCFTVKSAWNKVSLIGFYNTDSILFNKDGHLVTFQIPTSFNNLTQVVTY